VNPRTGKLERVPAAARIDALLMQPNATAMIRQMDPQSVYSLVVEAGKDEAFELLMQISGEQCQALVDFDCWRRDDLRNERLDEWLDVLLQREDEGFVEMLQAMDPEVLVIWLRTRTQILLWEDDLEMLDQIDAPVMTSPDGVYAIILPEDDEEFAARLRLLLDRVYAWDLQEGHRLLEGVRWELTTDMQERAYQYRNARLGDLGFVPVHEAVEVFAVVQPSAWVATARAVALDPTSSPVHLSSAGMLPPVEEQLVALELRAAADGGTWFHRALASLPKVLQSDVVSVVIDTVFAQLRSVANRVHIANLGQAGDLTAGRDALLSAVDNVSLALELASEEDDTMAARILSHMPLQGIHQAGYSIVARMAHQARGMSARGNLTLLDDVVESLLTDADRDLMDGLRQRRPVRSGETMLRFETMAQVQSAARRLGDIAFTELLFFGWLRITRQELIERVVLTSRCTSAAEEVSFRSLLATLALRRMARLPVEVEPLTLAQLHLAQLMVARTDDPLTSLVQAGMELLTERGRVDDATAPLVTRAFTDVAAWLQDQVQDWARPLPASIASTLVLLGRVDTGDPR
jgi:hypothetical protein